MVTITRVVALGIDTDLVALCCAFSTFINICVESRSRAKGGGGLISKVYHTAAVCVQNLCDVYFANNVPCL